MGDEGTSTHVLVEHGTTSTGKLKMSSKSYNLQSQINLNRGRRGPKLLIWRLSRENKPREFMWKRTSRLTWSSRLLSLFRRTSRFLPRD
ncbi:hypothetical protein ABFA07_015638 [Porites harrisoni]